MSERTIAIARDILAAEPLFLDTETTGLGLDDEVVEVAVVDATGKVLLETLVKPAMRIPAKATAIHGITDEMVAGAQTFAEVHLRLLELLNGKTVVIYNADYDRRLLRQSARVYGLQGQGPQVTWWCAMLVYAEHRGDWDDYRCGWRWVTLEKAARECTLETPETLHRAAADAELTRRLVLWMAAQAEVEQRKDGNDNA